MGFARVCFNPLVPSDEIPVKQPSVYLKMRVLGAVDSVEGRTRHERIHTVAVKTFFDEQIERAFEDLKYRSCETRTPATAATTNASTS